MQSTQPEDKTTNQPTPMETDAGQQINDDNWHIAANWTPMHVI